MADTIAVLDTNIVILLTTAKEDDSPEEVAREQRRQHVRSCIKRLQKDVRFVIPAVVVAELGRDSTPQEVLDALTAAMGMLRFVSLTRDIAKIAATMARARLNAKPLDGPRGAVKFDTLIAATAHGIGAKYLVTDDAGRDIAKPLHVVRSPVEVVIATDPPPAGPLFERTAPQTPATEAPGTPSNDAA